MIGHDEKLILGKTMPAAVRKGKQILEKNKKRRLPARIMGKEAPFA